MPEGFHARAHWLVAILRQFGYEFGQEWGGYHATFQAHLDRYRRGTAHASGRRAGAAAASRQGRPATKRPAARARRAEGGAAAGTAAAAAATTRACTARALH